MTLGNVCLEKDMEMKNPW